ncbi:unnamed protein product [Musa acuminata subsp. malaccensis]|uniref:(wild Malaysian banana) hypothetical protein n=1 Tax=Musa acuminata subsp. malaccensis TaxID=214687 RepID=A0A804I020_MUSAM|nr:unnamed protein product [Musa acuminata subsp. malaccensis]
MLASRCWLVSLGRDGRIFGGDRSPAQKALIGWLPTLAPQRIGNQSQSCCVTQSVSVSLSLSRSSSWPLRRIAYCPLTPRWISDRFFVGRTGTTSGSLDLLDRWFLIHYHLLIGDHRTQFSWHPRPRSSSRASMSLVVGPLFMSGTGFS